MHMKTCATIHIRLFRAIKVVSRTFIYLWCSTARIHIFIFLQCQIRKGIFVFPFPLWTSHFGNKTNCQLIYIYLENDVFTWNVDVQNTIIALIDTIITKFCPTGLSYNLCLPSANIHCYKFVQQTTFTFHFDKSP